MPDFTIHVSDADWELLGKMGDQLGLSERRMAERLVHRTLNVAARRPLVTHKQRSSDRAVRQLELLRILRRRRFSSLNQTDKRALAERFGVAERTIYRDIDVLLRTRGDAPTHRRTRDTTDAGEDDTEELQIAMA